MLTFEADDVAEWTRSASLSKGFSSSKVSMIAELCYAGAQRQVIRESTDNKGEAWGLILEV